MIKVDRRLNAEDEEDEENQTNGGGRLGVEIKGEVL